MFVEIYRELISKNDLRPNKKINALFSSLVSQVLEFNDLSEAEANQIMSGELKENEILELQKICAKAEAELEKYWGKLIAGGEKKLKQFPYYQNYIDLSELEISLLDKEQPGWDKSPVLFLGGGALPMTAIVLACLRKVKSTIVDIDEKAIQLAKQVIAKLELDEMIEVIHSSGEDFGKYKKFPVIYVAALAGIEEREKQVIFREISKQVGKKQVLLARSNWGVRKILYRPVPDLSEYGFKQILKFDPKNEIVNSVVLLKKLSAQKNNFKIVKVSKTVAEEARGFCLKQIKNEYGYGYVAEWHADLDTLGSSSGMYSKAKKGAFLTAWKNKKIVGSLGMKNLNYKKELWKKYSKRFNSKKIASIWRTYTVKEFRGRGIASQLLGTAEKIAAEMGYEFSYLHTSHNKPASLKYWQNRGYQIIDEENNQDKTVHMIKKLDSGF